MTGELVHLAKGFLPASGLGELSVPSTLLHGSENEIEEQVNEFRGLLVSLTCDSLAIS
jgi:hypothetical protein